MLPKTHRQFILAKRPNPNLDDGVLRLETAPVPSPGADEALVQNLFLSIDPTNRIWMEERPSYLPPITLGSVMRGLTGGRIVASRSSAFKPGDLVVGLGGWSEYAVARPGEMRVIPEGTDLTAALGLFGHIGLTAYFGLLDVGQAKAGETVLVSAAAGATGSLVGQIAKNKGCRVVGTAGSDDKVAWLTQELGFDAAFNYRKVTNWTAEVARLCPKGVDVYFDNVGGPMLDAALANLAMRGRVVLCGAISQYNEAEIQGPKNYLSLLMKRGRMEGFIVLDYMPRADEAVAALSGWLQEGKLRSRVEVVEGLENAPGALGKLFDGTNQGKLIVKIAD